MSDSDVRAARFRDANQRFYSSTPWSYFRIRASGLMLVGAQSHHLDRALTEGLTYLGLTVIEPPNDLSDDEGKTLVDLHVAIDSQILLHHAAEALLRVYLAHVGNSLCPWLTIARARNWRTFEKNVSERILNRSEDERFRNDVSRVFVPPSMDDRDVHAVRLIAYLREFARVVLDDGDVYNSMKHGLTALPGMPFLRIGDEDDSLPALTAEGVAVEFIRRHDDETTRMRAFRRETQWLDVRYSLVLVDVAAALIENAWTVARERFLEVPGGSIRMPIYAPADLPRKSGIASFSLFTVHEEPIT